MSILENILYGLVSGVTEFLPISAGGHQALLRYLFGTGSRSSLQDLLVHIGVLLSLVIACREDIAKLFREQKIAWLPREKRPKHLSKNYYDLLLLKTGILPLLIGLILFASSDRFENNLMALVFMFLANGIILLIAEHTRHGNRDARTMAAFDGVAMGLAGVASVLPGISGTGTIISYATIRGASTQSAANWAILLGIPATLFGICNDAIRLSATGLGAASNPAVAGYVFVALAAFCGAYIGISVLRLIATHSTVFQFAYYSIGTAIFTFILYLLT